MRVRADGEDDFSGSEPDEMGGGLFAETGVGAGDEDGLGGEGGGGWWGFVDKFAEGGRARRPCCCCCCCNRRDFCKSGGFFGGWGWN